MNTVFADTAFYLAFLNPRDEWYAQSQEVSRTLEGVTLTTEYVLLELGSHLCLGRNRGIFVRFVEMLRRHPKSVIVSTSSALFDAGLALFSARIDKDWSLVDCISFVVMK